MAFNIALNTSSKGSLVINLYLSNEILLYSNFFLLKDFRIKVEILRTKKPNIIVVPYL